MLGKILFIFITGFWPSVLIAALIINGAPKNEGSGYWAAVPWIFIFSLPFSFLSFLTSIITVAIYHGSKEAYDRRMNLAYAWFICSTVLLAAFFWKFFAK